MRKVFAFVVLLFLAVSLRPVLASAPVRYYDWDATTEISSRVLGVATPSASAKNFLQFNRYLVGGNLTPDNPLYFIKGFQEGVQFALTFDPKAKEKMRLELAGERLGEMQIMADKAKTAAVKSTAQNYQRTMEDATKNLKDNSSKELETEIAKHRVVLGEVAAKAPNAAGEEIKKAIQASEKSADVIADLNGRPAMPPDVVDRITALKAQGLLTPEEANKLISFKTRVEARQELRKYTDSGVLPAADLLRMNEQMKASFPQDFYKIHEMERFEEMKKLEGQKLDPNTQKRVQEFAKTYKPGEIVPADIRSSWAPLVRLEEMQNTFRPDLIDPKLFKNNPDGEKKFKEIVERYKPRQEDVDFVKKYMDKNKTAADQLPPEYQRMYNLSQAYGVQTAKPPTQEISCPTNAHYANGYCIPNYTPRGDGAYCPGGYHRSYQDGPCFPDNSTGGYLPSLTTTPGNYPSPFYPPTNQNTNNAPGGSTSPSRESQEAACKSGGGTCVSWVNNACGCERNANYPTACAYPQGGCGSNNYWDASSCQCRSNANGPTPAPSTYSSRESQEAACRSGGGTCTSWNNGACSCQGYSSQPSNYTPPSGYGSCSGGQYWNGSSCVSSPAPQPMPTPSPTPTPAPAPMPTPAPAVPAPTP